MGDITVLTQRFADAVTYASRLHADQPRKGTGTPYISHLLGAASLVLDQGGDEDEAIAALLHDALEDQGHKTSEAEIRRRFGHKVADIVAACSDYVGPPDAKPPWRERKEAYLAHLPRQPAHVLRVSLADKLHNARAIVADLRTEGDELWGRFTGTAAEQAWYYKSLLDIYIEHYDTPLVEEFAVVVNELVARANAGRMDR